jgi:hypothetical protein
MTLGINDLPDDLKKAFEDLTMIEEMLIAPLLAIMSIFRLPGGQLVSRGFVANFSQDIQPIIDQLPRLPKDLPILILKKKNQINEEKQFIVCKDRVEKCIDYLVENNEIFKAHGIRKSLEALNALPVYGIPANLNVIEDDENISNIDNILVDVGPEIINNTSL